MGTKKERVCVYVDGFNLYFGMTEKFAGVKWLNIHALAESLLKPTQTLIEVKYFTSRVSNNPEKEKRQRIYLDALASTDITLIYGHYKSKPRKCNRCGHNWNDNEEKMTDVNIAVHMLTDALHDRYDMALLVSGDSDLVPPIEAIHRQFTGKRVMVAFPPNRHNNSVKNVARGSLIIGRAKLKAAQFPIQVKAKDGFMLEKPGEWD